MRSQARILSILVLLLLAACSSTVGPDDDEDDGCTPTPLPYHDPLTQSGAVRDVHDPAIIQHGDSYYLFSTGHGIPMRRSGDLINWEPAGQVFTDLPSWVETTISGVEFPWAPDVAFFNDAYHLYYSLSTFGSQRSVGLMACPWLSWSSPARSPGSSACARSTSPGKISGNTQQTKCQDDHMFN